MRSVAAMLVIALFSASSCGSAQPEKASAPCQGPKTCEASPAQAAAAPVPATPVLCSRAGWDQHRDPLGFAVSHPGGWTTEATADGAVVVRSPDGTAAALAAPFVARSGTSARQVVEQAPPALLSVFPGGRLAKAARIEPQGTDAVLASLTYGGTAGPGRAAVLCSVFDRSGMLFAIGAPADRYESLRPILVEVLKTLRFVPPAAPRGAPDAPARFTPWVDPNEKAFLVDVPVGWEVKGGLVRRNAVDPRPWIQVKSPQEDILLTSGDPTIPVYSLPGFSPFFPEGSDYSPGYGVVMKVRRYLTGAALARDYVQTRLGTTCANLVFTGSRDRPDIAQAVNAVLSQYNATAVQTQVSMGEVTFTCTYQGKAIRGYWFMATQLTSTDMGGVRGGIWTVPHSLGCLAVPEKWPAATAIMGHMIQSTRLNPEWVRMQEGLTRSVSDIVTDTNRALSGIIKSVHETRQATGDKAMRNWSNMTLGQVDLVDPDTGQTYRAASGHNYYWRPLGSDVPVGTNTYDRPNIDMTPLAQW